MEKMLTVTIFKDNGDWWKTHINVPKSTFKIVDGFVTFELNNVYHMYPIHKIGKIEVEEQ